VHEHAGHVGRMACQPDVIITQACHPFTCTWMHLLGPPQPGPARTGPGRRVGMAVGDSWHTAAPRCHKLCATLPCMSPTVVRAPLQRDEAFSTASDYDLPSGSAFQGHYGRAGALSQCNSTARPVTVISWRESEAWPSDQYGL